MKTAISGESSSIIPKRRQKHYSYDESVDEPATLIEDEPVEIEEDNNSDTPAFEE